MRQKKILRFSRKIHYLIPIFMHESKNQKYELTGINLGALLTIIVSGNAGKVLYRSGCMRYKRGKSVYEPPCFVIAKNAHDTGGFFISQLFHYKRRNKLQTWERVMRLFRGEGLE